MIDTLPNGVVIVHNPAEGTWTDETAWTVVEQVRIGSADSEGPDLFGNIAALEADALGRLYVFDAQAQELRVFEANGAHVRTIGRRGGGPGEFAQVIGMVWGPDGNLWTVDPSNNRISLFDTAGSYVGSHRTLGGYVMMPWPGGVDTAGHFYTYAPNPAARPFGMVLVRYNAAMEPLDTIRPPRYEGPRNFFEHSMGHGFVRAGVPFSPGLVWRLAPTGHIWFALTGEYRLVQRTLAGDTLRVVTRAFDPLPVTGEEIDSAIADLEWFTQQGGTIDRARFPSVKPAIQGFYLDDAGYLWVVPVTPDMARLDPGVLDVFDPPGRYLGRVELPFRLSQLPPPVFRRGMLYGVTRDELGVPYVVSARIVKP